MLLDAVSQGTTENKPIPFIREKLFGYLSDEDLWKLHEYRVEKKFWAQEVYTLLVKGLEERERIFTSEFREKVAAENPSLNVWGVKKLK